MRTSENYCASHLAQGLKLILDPRPRTIGKGVYTITSCESETTSQRGREKSSLENGPKAQPFTQGKVMLSLARSSALKASNFSKSSVTSSWAPERLVNRLSSSFHAFFKRIHAVSKLLKLPRSAENFGKTGSVRVSSAFFFQAHPLLRVRERASRFPLREIRAQALGTRKVVALAAVGLCRKPWIVLSHHPRRFNCFFLEPRHPKITTPTAKASERHGS